MNTPPLEEKSTPDEGRLTPGFQAVELTPVIQTAENFRGLINENVQIADDGDGQNSVPADTGKNSIPKNVKTAFPLLGNYLFSVTGPFISREKVRELKAQQKMQDTALMKDLEKNYKDQYQAMKALEIGNSKLFDVMKDVKYYQSKDAIEELEKTNPDLLKAMNDLEKTNPRLFVVMEELRDKYPDLYRIMKHKRGEIIKALKIMNLSELRNRSGDKGFVKEIRERVALAMVDDLVPKNIQDNIRSGDKDRPGHTYLPAETIQTVLLQLSESKLKSLADEADTLIKYVDEKFFPNTGSNPPTGLINEIENEHDLGKLILIVADEKNYDAQTRYQALRKIAFIELFAKLTKIDEDRESQHNCLSFLDEVFNSGLYSKKDGRKIGHYETKFLITHLDDGGDYVYSDLLTDQNEAKAMVKSNPSLQSTPIPMRTFDIEDENGELIEGLVDSRVKTRLSEALKMLRKNTIDPNQSLKDLNGERLVFKSENEIKLFDSALQKKLKALGEKVKIFRQKDEVGEGKLKIRKINIQIGDKHYEFQIFTFNEYANYLYKQPYSWPEYEVDRFHGSSSSEATHPSDVNPDLDREEAAELARMQAKHTVIGKIWESNGNGKQGNAPTAAQD